jgi:hypothetical protein
MGDSAHSNTPLYSQADLDNARAQSFSAAHNQSLEVSEYRLKQQAMKWHDVVEAKEWQIGNLTDLLESNSDNARLEKHAARLKSRREGMLKRVLDEDAEAELFDIETRLAATEELISKNERISDFEKQEKTQGDVPESTSISLLLSLPWMLVFALSLALIASGSLQVCRARLKAFSGYKDMPDSELNSVGPGQIGNRT